MGYRGTREQLEARWTALPAELSAMHDQLMRASARVEAVRASEWGALGVWWFRFTLRRALRAVDTSARWDGRSLPGLIQAVEQHERALGQGRAVVRWLEEALAPSSADEASASPKPSPSRSAFSAGLRDALAVIGAAVRSASVLVRPLLVVLGLVALVASLVAREDADGLGGGWDVSSSTEVETSDERHAADVQTGALTVALVLTVAAGGAALVAWLQ